VSDVKGAKYEYVADCEDVCIGHFVGHYSVSQMANAFRMSEEMVCDTITGAWGVGVSEYFMTRYLQADSEAMLHARNRGITLAKGN
jgi:hypothetical protein